MTSKSNAPRLGDDLSSEKRTTERGLGVAPAVGTAPTGPADDWETATNKGETPRGSDPVATARTGRPRTTGSAFVTQTPGNEAEQVSLPVELVSSATNEPRVLLIAPSGITVHVGRASESPPPVQINYTEPTRAIPYRAAIPIAIIIFATGVVAYSLLTRGNGQQRAATNLQPTAAAIRASAPVGAAARAPSAADPPAPASSQEPVILLDLPADDPQAPLATAENPGEPNPAVKPPPSTRRTQARPKMHFQEPE